MQVSRCIQLGTSWISRMLCKPVLDPLSGSFHLVYLCQSTFSLISWECHCLLKRIIYLWILNDYTCLFQRLVSAPKYSSEPHWALIENTPDSQFSQSKYRPTDRKFPEMFYPIRLIKFTPLRPRTQFAVFALWDGHHNSCDLIIVFLNKIARLIQNRTQVSKT